MIYTGQRKWQGEDATWVQRHSLSLFLGGLWLAQSLLAVWAYYLVWVNAWDTAPQDWSLGIFAVFFGAVYMTSLVADSYGACILVLAQKWFFEAGSDEADSAKDPES